MLRDPNQLHDVAVAALRARDDGSPDSQRNALITAATAFVDVRQFMFTKDNLEDWSGHTVAYRAWVADVMDAAEISADDRPGLETSLGQHIHAVVSRRMSPSLRTNDPGLRRRAAAAKERQARLLNLLSGTGSITTGDDLATVSAILVSCLHRVQPAAVESMPSDQRAAVGAELAVAADIAAGLADSA